jgi:hypothetical protein
VQEGAGAYSVCKPPALTQATSAACELLQFFNARTQTTNELPEQPQKEQTPFSLLF